MNLKCKQPTTQPVYLYRLSRLKCVIASFAICLLALTYNAQSQLVINFSAVGDGGNLDGAGVGASQTFVDGPFSFDLTTVDLLGQDGLSNVADSRNNQTIITSLGFGMRTQGGDFTNDAQNFNVGEAWSFSFDQDLTFDALALGSYTTGLDVNLTFLDGTNSGAGTNYLLNTTSTPTIGYNYTSGTVARLSFDGLGTTTDPVFRLTSFTVTAVPEPSSFALLFLGGSLLLFLRRRKN